jgi:hypothetical protein
MKRGKPIYKEKNFFPLVSLFINSHDKLSSSGKEYRVKGYKHKGERIPSILTLQVELLEPSETSTLIY